MGLNITVEPVLEPITTAEAKTHLRVDLSDEDEYIDTLIVTSRQFAENHTRRQLITATWQLTLDWFPCVIELRRPPIQSVTSITYVDTDGDTQTLDSSLYRVDVTGVTGCITPAFGESWPSTRAITSAVTVTYVAGYGDAGSDVPAAFKHAIKLLLAHYHENREESISGTIITTIPVAAARLLDHYRIMEAH